jgi:hypothetical protein
MGYEARMEAAAEYASEVALDMIRNGDFDSNISDLIAEGNFDDQISEMITEGKFDEVIISRIISVFVSLRHPESDIDNESIN